MVSRIVTCGCNSCLFGAFALHLEPDSVAVSRRTVMRTSWTLSAIAAAAFALGIAGGFTFAKQRKLEYTMVPAGTSNGKR